MDVGLATMLGAGGFWTASGAVFAHQMRNGRFDAAKKVHQDMDPTASNRRWWIKVGSITAVGALWLAAGVSYLLDSNQAMNLVKVGLGAFLVEQLLTPILGPKHWKAYTGVVLGVALPAFIWSRLV
ncbi:hypothetical protein HPC49_10235 [Pyxidicoccus fallax]|uniref:Uncharacterized protein n=1 Tax=Pyxidicoccus fallax TaxID=394095 RepID=A0A848LJZ6_9BACT|nr:hypothetical protein [Pyxidicoccus fallax]NMO18030.1 hypothetical protein [Pyxidicoccus fallax]NPC78620.1 hypothetical protein [Pyxidicoccus fallax]